MTDDPLDLTPLDPDHDPRAADRFVAGVMGRLAANPDPYPVPVGLVWGLSSMALPVAAAALVILALAAGLEIRSAVADPPAPQTVAESIGVPGLFHGALAAAGLPPAEERR
jgi:hypothetical protein